MKTVTELVRMAKEHGLALTGADRLPKQLTKSVVETALNKDMTEILDSEKNDLAGHLTPVF